MVPSAEELVPLAWGHAHAQEGALAPRRITEQIAKSRTNMFLIRVDSAALLGLRLYIGAATQPSMAESENEELRRAGFVRKAATGSGELCRRIRFGGCANLIVELQRKLNLPRGISGSR